MASSVKKLGRYSIYDAFASGGMATVHLARFSGPAGFARTVAVKRLHPELGREPELVAALADEARLCSRVQHPNVIPIVDVVADVTELCLVMEYVPGVTLGWLLHELRSSGARLPLDVTLAVADSVLAGLSAAHRATDEHGRALELVHRDISPQNILLGSDGVVRILDFGVAKASGRSQATRGSVWKGKPAYMAPEQLRGDGLDARADVYACAVVLWEMLTGHRLFSGDSEQAVVRRVLGKIIDAPSRIVAGLPEGLDAVVMRGLERDVGARFESAEAMQLALREQGERAAGDRVAALVSDVGKQQLDERARLLSEVERTSELSAVPAHAGNQPRTTPRWPWLIAGLGLAVSGAWYAWPSSSTESPLQSFGSSRPELTSVPPVTSLADSAGSGAASALTAAEPAASLAPPVRAPQRSGTPASSASQSCDPPYVVDSEGFHRMKPECLK